MSHLNRSAFLDIVQLCDASADGILEQLLNCLYKNGINKQFSQEFWLGLGTDSNSQVGKGDYVLS